MLDNLSALSQWFITSILEIPKCTRAISHRNISQISNKGGVITYTRYFFIIFTRGYCALQHLRFLALLGKYDITCGLAKTAKAFIKQFSKHSA